MRVFYLWDEDLNDAKAISVDAQLHEVLVDLIYHENRLFIKARAQQFLNNVSSLLIDWEFKNFANKAVLKYFFFLRDTKGVDDSLNGVRAALVRAN